MHLQIAERYSQDRNVEPMPVGTAHEVADDLLSLGAASRLEIIKD